MSDETPSAESPSEPIADTPVEAPTAEATETVAPPGVAADPVPVAPEPVPVAAASEPKHRGVFVPAWVGAVILVLAVAGLGFGVGRWTADDSTSKSTAIANNGGIVPQFPNGNGGGQTTPQTPNTPSTGAAFLGVATQDATGGVEVVTVGANSPASKAGIAQGDVITAIDNTSVTTTTSLRAAIQSHDAGDSVTVHYTRDGKAATVTVTLGTQSQ